MAFLLMGLPLLSKSLPEEEGRRVNKFLCVPLVVSMVGLVASATHLGSPANALYVFSAVGSSPLSNEVACAVLFLLLAGLYWLYSFSEAPSRHLMKAWLICIDLAVIAFIAAVGLAYSARTIPSWNLWQVPLGIAANACLGGPLLALVSYAMGRCACLNRKRSRNLLTLGAVGAGANILIYASQIVASLPLRNALRSVGDLVPDYPVALAAFTLLAVGALTVGWRAAGLLPDQGMFSEQEARTARLVLGRFLLAALLGMAAIFIMRFCFYMSHITVGLGV